MRKLTQKLVLSVVTMALVVIALGTSTFAWFTLTNKASIASFNAQVTAGEGIEITLGDWDSVEQEYTAPVASTVWYTVLPSAVIQAYVTNMYDSFRFDNLTSADGKTIRNEGLNTVTYSRSAKYIEFKLYFRSTAEKTITWNSASLSGSAQPWVVNVPSFLASDNITTWAINTTQQVSAWTAARVSIEGSSTFTYQAAEGIVGGVYNSNAGVESYDFADVSGAYTVGAGAGEPYGAAAYGIQAGKTTTYGATLPAIHATSNVNSTPVAILTLAGPTGGFYTGNVTVRVWIEGFDADAFDAIFNSTLSVQLGFAVQE